MVKRKLSKKERILTKKGIKIRSDRIKENKEELNYLNDFDKFNKKYESYLAKKDARVKQQKADQILMARKNLKAEIKFDEEALLAEKLQLTEGVDVKEMVGVN